MPSIWINFNGRILKTDVSWDSLASKNNADELTGASIMGRSIWTFIKGDTARMFLDAIITRVKITEKPYVLHYRCDRPGKAQFMRMLVSKEDEDIFLIEHDIIGAEKISPKINFVEDEEASEERCAVCGRVKFKGRWYDALTHRYVFGTLTELKTKSSLCEECEEKLAHDGVAVHA